VDAVTLRMRADIQLRHPQ